MTSKIEKLAEWLKNREKIESNGYEISKNVKKRLKLTKDYKAMENLTYGEIDVHSFYNLLKEIKSKIDFKPTKFYDIGSGTGKAVLCVPFVYSNIETCTGLEIVKELHQYAEDTLTKLLNESNLDVKTEVKKCSFSFGDSFTKDNISKWTKGDLLFLPTTCFTEETLKKVVKCLEQVKNESIIICTTRVLKASYLKLIFKKRFSYSKGSLKFLVYKKIE